MRLFYRIYQSEERLIVEIKFRSRTGSEGGYTGQSGDARFVA